MAEISTVKRIHRWKTFRGRPDGRHKSRWEDGDRKGLKEMRRMKWTEQVQDCIEWKDIVEKTTNVPEM